MKFANYNFEFMEKAKLLYSTDKKILILDDHDMRIVTMYVLWRSINACFKRAPCKVVPMELVKEWKPDLVVLDVFTHLGVDYGFELMQQLEENPETSHIPIIVYTSYGEKWCIENNFFREGVDAYVCKPLHEDLISIVVQKLKKLDEDVS